MSKNEEKVPRSVGTHDGPFHADEVTACALLALVGRIDPHKIRRTRDPKVLATCDYVCDVGGHYDPKERFFDHHQADYIGPMSSAGMVLAYLREQGDLTQEEYEFFNSKLVQGVDAHDNGHDVKVEGMLTFSNMLSYYTPVPYDVDETTFDKSFFEAFDLVLGLLQRMRRRFAYVHECGQIVAKAMESGKECLLFDRGIPWQESFFAFGGEEHPARFIIMPSGKHWKLRGIPPNEERRMEVRQPLPERWAGLLAKELKKVSGISGAIFCHKGRFISVWETKEDALKALSYILENETK